MAKRKRKGRAGCLTVAAVLAAAMAASYLWAESTGYMSMPDVVGMDVASAVEAMERNSVYDRVSLVTDDGSAAEYCTGEDTVTAQSVPAGDSVGEGDGATVTVDSKGDRLVDMLLANAGDSVSKVHQSVLDLGYSPSYLQNDTQQDITGMVVADATGANADGAVDWVVVTVEKPDTSAKTVRMLVSSRELLAQQRAHEQMRKELESKFSAATAWEYVKRAGQDRYPYGFDLHSIMGVISETPVDSSTWRLSATCDVRNALGVEAKDRTCTCEVRLNGSKVEILSFSVY